MLAGETIASGVASTCRECGTKLTNQVLRSTAGFYIGTRCECGPYSRESDYYATEADAQKDLDANAFTRS